MNRGSLVRDRDFCLVAGSVGLPALGDWVAIVALGLEVKQPTDSGFRGRRALDPPLRAPRSTVAGHAGLLVDRIEATRLLAAASAIGAVAAAVVAFHHGHRRRAGAHGAALEVVFAVSSPPSLRSAAARRPDRVQEANGHVETARYIGFGLGPVLGALLYAGPAASSPRCASTRRPSLPSPAPRWRWGSGRARRRRRYRVRSGRDGTAYLFRDRTSPRW